MSPPRSSSKVAPMIALIVLVGVMVAPLATGAPPTMRLEGTLSSPIKVTALVAQLPPPSSMGDDAACTQAAYTANAGQQTFQFQDNQKDAGCLSVYYEVTIPSGTTQALIRFSANRDLEGGLAPAALNPPVFHQEFRIWNGQALIYSRAYFPHDNVTNSQQDFLEVIERPPDAPLRLEWWFLNPGGAPTGGTERPSQTQAWTSTVGRPRIQFEGIPLPNPVPVDEGGAVQKSAYAIRYEVPLSVPARYQAASDRGEFSLLLRMPTTALVDRLISTNSLDLTDDDYELAIVGSERLLTIPSHTLVRLGHGPYILKFQATEPVQVSSPMVGLALLALSLPAIGLGLAFHQIRQRSIDAVLGAAAGLEEELDAN